MGCSSEDRARLLAVSTKESGAWLRGHVQTRGALGAQSSQAQHCAVWYSVVSSQQLR